MRKLSLLCVVLCCVVVSTLFEASVTYAAAPGAPGGGNGSSGSSTTAKKGQDPAWVAKKQAHQVVRVAHSGKGGKDVVVTNALSPAAFPSASELSTGWVTHTEEPGANGTDVNGVSYHDQNMWRLCGAGAVDNTGHILITI